MIKGYLKDFLETPPDVKKSEKALCGQVPKVTKGASGTFGTSLQGDIPKVEGPSAGSFARPIRVHADRKPADCLFDDCAGRLMTRGPLWLCDSCGCWFTYAGPLSDDDRAILEERAAIKQFCAGMTRDQAETQAADEFTLGVRV